jgi:hypothetical protein
MDTPKNTLPLPPVPCSAAELALLRAMQHNRKLVGQYTRWPKTVALLKQELAWACDAFVENDEARMERLAERMMSNLEALPEWGSPPNDSNAADRLRSASQA